MAKIIKPNPESRAARAAAKTAEKVRKPPMTSEAFDRWMAAATTGEEKKKSGRPASLLNADTGEPIDDIDIAWFIERIKIIRGVNAREAAKLLHQMWRLPESYDPEKLRKRGSPHRNEVAKPERPEKAR